MVLLFTYAPIAHLSRPWSSIAVNVVSVLKNIFVVSFQILFFFMTKLNISGPVHFTQGMRHFNPAGAFNMVQPLYDSVLANLVHFYILTRLPL
jgi:hypothetical protein